MKNILFIILVVVAAVLLWAIRAEAYSSGLVFSLGLIATALSGYLIADYFLKVEKKSLENNLHVSQKENQALKERVDLLQTQINTAKPPVETEQFDQRIALLEDQKNKLDGMSRAQTAEISSLIQKLETLQNSHAKLQEDSAVTIETANTQIAALKEEINSKTLKNQALIDENTALHIQNVALIEELNAKIPSDTEGGKIGIASDDTLVTSRGLDITELDLDDDDDDDVPTDFGTSDNLQAIDGIGEKVSAVLKDAGISTWEILSMTSLERLRVVLDEAGLHTIYPTSWPEQARLLVHREFAKLKKYKALIAGE
jgi:hypothetical protein